MNWADELIFFIWWMMCGSVKTINFWDFVLVKLFLDKYENVLTDDFGFYRFLSLNMFAEPELYQEKWFEQHLNNIFELLSNFSLVNSIDKIYSCMYYNLFLPREVNFWKEHEGC